MLKCPNCGYENLPGTLFCDDCAEPLQIPVESLAPDTETQWLSALQSDSAYALYHDGNTLWLIVQPEVFYLQRKRLIKGRLLIGRIDSTPEYSTIKLDALNIDELGVSRLHAALLPLESGIGLADVGSTNGTRLNGQVLTKGRIYNLNPMDAVEFGKLMVRVHFVEQETFLQAVRRHLLSRFEPAVQEILGDMNISTEALMFLQEHLSGKGEKQLQVLSLFKERAEPVTIQHLLQRINMVIGEISKPLHGELEGESTRTLRDEAMNELKDTTPAAVSNAIFRTYLQKLHDDGTRIERILKNYLNNADKLPTPSQQQQAVNLITPMLVQLSAWLPTIEAAKKEQNDS